MTDQDRAEFEAWAKSMRLNVERSPCDGSFRTREAKYAYLAWLAARRTQAEQVRELVETWIGMKDTRRACVYLNAPEIAEAINTLAARLKETQDD